MIEKLYEGMDLYEECRCESIIFKKFFYENENITKSEKDILKNDVDKIIWKYSLKQENINVIPYMDEDIDYEEIELIQVNLISENKYKKVCELIQKVIPYPVILIIVLDNKVLINTAFKRINKNDETKNTVESYTYTDWIDLGNINENEKEFFDSINIKNLSFDNMYKLYSSFADKIEFLNASILTGNYKKLKSEDAEKIRELNEQIKYIDDEINQLKMQFKKEAQFNKKMDINIKIKKLENKKNSLIEKVKR